MSGRNRVFRRKVEDQGAEEPDSLGMPPASILAARKLKEKERKTGKKPALLSFDEEEGTSPVKAKADRNLKEKSKAKLKPDLKNLRLGDESRVTSQQSAAGEYSADKLRELRANAKSFTGPRAPMSSVHGPAETDGGGFKLSGSFKPAAAAAPPSGSGQNGAAQLPPPSRPKPTAVESPQPPPAAAPPAAEEEEADDFHVPSAEMIRLAKEKRERLRSAHLAPDYVPLGGAAGLANLEARLKPEGGLHQSQSEHIQAGSDSDDEARHQRTTFIGKAQPAGVFSAAAETPQALGGDEEDDYDKWVQEQIRKGVRGGAPSHSQAPAAEGGYSHGPSASREMPLAGSKAAAESWTANGEAALKTLQQSLLRLETTRANIEKQTARTQENLKGSIEAVTQLQTSLEAAGDKYTFLQQLKGYIADLCEMLQAKDAIVEELEAHLMAAGQQRAAELATRSAGDESAELEPASAAVSAALGVLSRGGELRAAMAAASTATQQAEERLAGTAGPAEVDEFGRDIGREADYEETRRRERILSRNQRWESDVETQGGADTTDESDSEEAQYERRRNEVVETSTSLFADADEEYGSLAAVKRRLEGWLRDHPDAYANAYAADSVPAIFAPFVRNQLLAWDPIFQNAKDFDQQQWYHTLLDYGRSSSGLHATSSSADGDELIPVLVSNLVFPRARHSVQVCWNPFSRRQTRRCVGMLEHLLVFFSADDPKMKEIFGAAQQRLESSAALLKMPPWPAAATAAAANATLFLAHRFGKALRLISNVAAFDALLPRNALRELVFERLIQQQLLTYISGAPLEVAIHRSERLINALPQPWLGAGRVTKPLTDALARFATGLASRRTSSDAALARRLAAILDRCGESQSSASLRSAFKLQT